MNTSVETNVWGRILHSLKGRLNQQTLDTWFSPIQFESLESRRLMSASLPGAGTASLAYDAGGTLHVAWYDSAEGD